METTQNPAQARSARTHGGAPRLPSRGIRGRGSDTVAVDTAAFVTKGLGSSDVARAEGGPIRRRGGRGGSNHGRGTKVSGDRSGSPANGAKRRPAYRDAVTDDLEAGSSPAEMAKQAKNSAGILNGLLKEKAPWDSEVEHLRHEIRTSYQIVLFDHPTSPVGQSIEPLWIFTSHILIGAYRLLIAEYEKRVQEFTVERASIPNALRRGGGRGNRRGTGRRSDGPEGAGPGPVELRKLLGRFKAFLTAEQKYYKDLIGRIVESFGLQAEVEGFLEVLDIHLGQRSDRRIGGRLPGETRLEDRARGATPTGRTTPTPAPALPQPLLSLTRDEVTKKIGMVHKALICLGDLERYREQCGPDKAKKPQAMSKGKTVAKGDVQAPSEQYAGAKRYYEVARGLLPDNGNPSNQLAVVSSYCQDTFSAIYHYFRALTVQDPFQTAEYNLAKTLRKALREWEVTRTDGPDGSLAASFPALIVGNEVGSFKREEVIIQAVMYTQDDCARLQPLIHAHLIHFATLLQDRQIPSEIIVKTLVLGIMGHWHAKINHAADSVEAGVANATTLTMEYLLKLAQALLKVAISELEAEMGAEAVTEYLDNSVFGPVANVFEEDDEEQDGLALHKRLSAVTRRMLPALRIFSKWLKSNQDQVNTLLEFPSDLRAGCYEPVSETARLFWQTYFDFLGRLEWTFPIERLPKLLDQLEEDMDMRGLSPLSRGMSVADHSSEALIGEQGRKRLLSEVHPNEEQLMRVSDLLIDGTMLVQGDAEKGMMAGRFARRVFATHSDAMDGILEAAGKTPPARPSLQLTGGSDYLPTLGLRSVPLEHEAEIASVSTEAEDDPVNLAMRATMLDGSSLADDDDRRSLSTESSGDEEEKVLWNAAANAFDPDRHPPMAAPGISGTTSGTTNTFTPPARPTVPNELAGSAMPATAQSLLHSLLSGPPAPSTSTTSKMAQTDVPSTAGHAAKRSSLGNAGNANLLFGSGPGMSPSSMSNIWSTGKTPHLNDGQDTGGPGSAPGSYSRSSFAAPSPSMGNSTGVSPNPWGPPSSPAVLGMSSGWSGLGNGTSGFATSMITTGPGNGSSQAPSGFSSGMHVPHGQIAAESRADFGSVPMPRPTLNNNGNAHGGPANHSYGPDALIGMTGPGVIGQGFRQAPGAGGGAGWG